MLMMGDELPKERGRHRTKVEDAMIKKREREFRHQMVWEGAQKNYKRWDNVNTKYDHWTSPRYYEENNKLLLDLQVKKNKEDNLTKRREKLKKLLEEDDRSYQIELMVQKNHPKPREECEKISTALLKDVNSELKLREEEKKRREAELKLYHQWRINNPIVRQLESKFRFKDLKLSWLDQQIEKRLQKEKEEERCQKIIKEQEERIRIEIEKEEIMKKEFEEKKRKLKEYLDEQLEELKRKQKIAEELKLKEAKEFHIKNQVLKLEEKAQEENKKRLMRENALYNIKQHKMKLKQRAVDIQEALLTDQYFILKMKELQLEEVAQSEKKKCEIKQTFEDFSRIVLEQRELEKQRQKHLEFLFDSEAKAVFQKQIDAWEKEEIARKTLLKSILKELNKQIEDNINKNKEKQKQLLHEREEMLKEIENTDRELEEIKKQEELKKLQTRKMLEEDIILKNAKKKQEENRKLQEINVELERVKLEEERLRKEIIRIQKNQDSRRPSNKSKIY
ncbi:hypothetical protein ABEB36_014348 [Hypothenemus hampei]|uniref:Trichoplein keratin filament-binding protein n=1 Tax=Hypothenemus hampei TaxID=57062 RepID=A0ABD1E444_HYPHA